MALNIGSILSIGSSLIVIVLLDLPFLLQASSSSAAVLNFRLGTAIGQTGGVDCLGYEYHMYQGFMYALNVINNKPLYVTGADGASYRLMFDTVFYTQTNCNSTTRENNIRRLLDQDKVHFLLGGGQWAAEREIILSDKANTLTSLCCIAYDALFQEGFNWVFGTFVSSTGYVRTVLSTMALRGISRVAIVVAWDNMVDREFCNDALAQLAIINEFQGNGKVLEMALLVNYTKANVGQLDTWADNLVSQLQASRADGLLLCDRVLDRAIKFTRAYHASKLYMKSVWISVAPAIPAYTQQLGLAAEYMLTTVQWHEGMRYQDPLFGTARQFYHTYQAVTGDPPSEFVAGAAASLYLLASAIQDAFAPCDIQPTMGDADQLLFNISLICREPSTSRRPNQDRNGYDRLQRILSSMTFETFLGRVEFNGRHQNVGFQPVVVQIVGGQAEAVLPIDGATADLVMPIPPPAQPHPWVQHAYATASLIVGACLAAALLAVVPACVLSRRWRSLVSVVNAVTVPYDAVKVILAPVMASSKAGCEPGEGTYRGSRVALLAATELDVGKLLNHDGDGLGDGLESPRFPVLPQDSATLQKSARDETMSGPTGVLFTLPGAELGVARLEPERSAFSRRDMTKSVADIVFQIRDLGGNKHRRNWVATAASKKELAEAAWRLMRLPHSGLNPLLGVVWEWPGLALPVLVRELCSLGNLASLLENSTVTLALHDRCTIAAEVASTMTYLHAQVPPIYVQSLSANLVLIDSHFLPHLAVPLTCLMDSPPALSRSASSCDLATHGQGGSAAAVGTSPTGDRGVEVDILQYGWLLCQLFGEAGMRTTSLDLDMSQRDEHVIGRVQRMVEDALPSVAAALPSLASLIRKCIPPHANHVPAVEEVGEEMLLPLPPMPHGQEGVHPGFQSFQELEAALSACLSDLEPEEDKLEEVLSLRQPSKRLMRRSMQAHCRLSDIVEEGAKNRHNSKASYCSSKGEGSRATGSAGSLLNSDAGSAGRSSKKRNQDDLLFEIFPPKVARALQRGQEVQPERYEVVSIFFSDIVGYTDICAQLQPHDVMDMLNRFYTQLDALSREHNLFKVETIGDAYMAVANLRWPQQETHAKLLAQFALAAVEAANSVLVYPTIPELGAVNIRVGLHSGPVVASVVGTMNRRYCLFGDTVNTASRMESNSAVNRVHASKCFADLLAKQWPEANIEARGSIHIKGKGEMETYWISNDS